MLHTGGYIHGPSCNDRPRNVRAETSDSMCETSEQKIDMRISVAESGRGWLILPATKTRQTGRTCSYVHEGGRERKKP